MRECQLCGAKSWGPVNAIGQAALLKSPTLWGQDVVFSRFLQCDGCNAVASKSIVDKPLPDADFPRNLMADLSSHDPLDEARRALESLSTRLPESETRLERIVRAIVKSHLFEQDVPDRLASYMVTLGRSIEAEMDNKCDLVRNPKS